MVRSILCLVWTAFWVQIPLAAQTLLDLQTQSKSVNFQNAQFTRPLKTGAVLPALCTQADLFYLTTAAPGANIYGCVATNTWVPQSGSGGSGSTTIQNAGTVVGMRPILNLTDGPGLLLSTSDTGTTISIQSTLDTSVAVTRASAQSGASLLCSSASGSATAYTCAMSPTLTVYTTGMVLHWNPDVSGGGTAVTLNVDTLGAIPVKLADGVTNPSPLSLIAGRLLDIWYDGTVFRFVNSAGPAGVLGEVRPACAVSVRGRLWFITGATGVQDSLSVCAKDATDAYAWRAIY